jgi:hypothetical protein
MVTQKTRYDWDAIYRDYRTNSFTDSELSRKYGCSRTAIQKRSKREKWTRDLSTEVKKATAIKLRELDAEKTRVARGVASGTEREQIDDAATTRAELIKTHRNDINNLRELEQQLVAELRTGPTKLYLANYKGEIIEKTVGLTASERAAATANLAQVQSKRVALERQAFGIDDNDDPEETDINEIKLTITNKTNKFADEERDE